MKTAPAALVAYMQANEQFILANLYTVTLIDGTILRWTDAQQDVSVPQPGGAVLVWTADDLLVQGIKYKSAVGLDVDEQTVRLSYWPAGSPKATMITPVATGSAVPIAQALQEGLFDGALLQWDRVVLPEWGGIPVGNGAANPDGSISDGRVVMNVGLTGALKVGRIETQMTVRSHLKLLDITMPRNFWQPTCLHTFCDAGCTLQKANFAASGTVGTGATNLVVPWSGAAADIYDQGTIVFGSGQNAGVKAGIKKSSAGSLTLSYPLDYVPAEGDVFTAYQGCVKTHARCQLLGNTAHFRAYPDVPAPEAAA